MSQLQFSFHDTINLPNELFNKANDKCETQEQRIYLLMRSRSAMTPFEVQDIYNFSYPEIPITSIRRALSNLERMGLLKKTEWMKQGKYGKPNHKWMCV